MKTRIPKPLADTREGITAGNFSAGLVLISIFFVVMQVIATAGVTTSVSAPTADILSSSPLGTTDTALFDEAANANHARGQLFSLPDGSGTAYEITAITVKKSTGQTYVNDTLTLHVFEGTQAQWDTGTGHLTGIDGSDYYVDTTVTPLVEEAFSLNSAIADNDYVTFELTMPIIVNEDSDFGFFMTYDQGGGTEDRFRHREANTGGGRLSITTTSHSTSPDRKIVYFVQGKPVSPVGTVTTSASAPVTDVLATKDLGATPTNLFTYSANSNHARGQLFSLGDGSGSAFMLSAITIQKDAAQTFINDKMTLHIFRGTQAEWDTGTGHLDASSDFYDGTTVTPLHSESFTIDGAIGAGEFVTFELAVPLELDESEDFGFFFTYDQVGGANAAFSHREGNNGGRISIDQSAHSTSTRSMNHFVIGTPTGNPSAALTLGSPFQDRLVLQRDKPINIWGEALPSTAVSVSLNGITTAGVSDANGDWKIELPALASGGPYGLVVTSGSETVSLTDVLVGDVWFCFGQSNMVYTLNQMAAWHTAYENDIIANDNIRCLKIDQDAAIGEEESAGMSWLPNSTAGSWTAVGSVFAHQLNASTGVPVAIVWAAYGSSSIEGWMPLEMTDRQPYFAEMMQLYQSIGEYRSGDPLADRASNLGYTSNLDAINGIIAAGWTRGNNNADIFIRTRPNILYNKMVHPVRCMGISGFIWYQGEANAGTTLDAAQYGFSLPDMVTEYRERFEQGDLPFLGVQLPSYDTSANAGENWPWFREAQSQLETLPNAHLAVTIDTGVFGNIHPTDKEPIGIRLSQMARKYALGESIEADGPRFDSMSVSGDEVTITFTNATGLNSDVSAGLFQIAGPGSNPTFFAADFISVSRSTVTISSSAVTAPAEVRYAWIPVPSAFNTLKNADGFTAAPFRTDSLAAPGLGAQAPQSVNDSFEVDRDQSLDIPAPGVLGNDIDLNYDALTVSLVNDVSFGHLSLLADGSFSYTPESGYAGPDSFTYRCSDSGLNSSVATVSIVVNGESSPYFLWRSGVSWGSGDDQSQTGDPDFDGIANLLEFALDLNPVVPSTNGLPSFSLSGSNAFFDFNNAQPGIIYDVQISTDLENWSDPAFSSLTSESTTPVLIPASESVGGRLFVRLRVSE